MAQTWFISDLHLGHVKMLTFTNEDGSKLRPWTDSGQMAIDLVERWNALVSDGDRVFVVGDVSWNRTSLHLIRACRGKKILVAGNHDQFKASTYLEFFDDVRGVAELDGLGWVVTHIPIHPSCLEHRWRVNIHGHTHAKRVPNSLGTSDNRYFNVSVEAIDYAPISVPVIEKRLARHGLASPAA